MIGRCTVRAVERTDRRTGRDRESGYHETGAARPRFLSGPEATMYARPAPLPENFDGQVRLFPLPDFVAFPGNVMPLHIFESRYCEMFEEAIKGDQLITLATLEPGYEADYYGRPPLVSVACVGQVAGYEKTDQGTYNLVLIGLQRVKIEHEIEPVRAFRRARVLLLEDRLERAEDVVGESVGRTLASKVRKIAPSFENIVADYLRGEASLAALTDVLAFHLPLDLQSKLRLLKEIDVRTRAEMLLGVFGKIADAKRRPQAGTSESRSSSKSSPDAERSSRRFPGEFSDN